MSWSENAVMLVAHQRKTYLYTHSCALKLRGCQALLVCTIEFHSFLLWALWWDVTYVHIVAVSPSSSVLLAAFQSNLSISLLSLLHNELASLPRFSMPSFRFHSFHMAHHHPNQTQRGLSLLLLSGRLLLDTRREKAEPEREREKAREGMKLSMRN